MQDTSACAERPLEWETDEVERYQPCALDQLEADHDDILHQELQESFDHLLELL